jgi:hypothetical protein
VSSRRQPLLHNILLGVLGSASYAVLAETGGRIAVNHGLGWDGANYVRMMVDGIDHGSANTQLRPAIVLLNRVGFWIQPQPIAAFELMNVLYAGLFAVSLAFILDSYDARPAAKWFFVATVAISIATAQMLAYYPVLIDLGAYTVAAAAILFAVRGPSVATAVLCVLAALSREFGIAVAAFGVCRAIRFRVRPWRIAAVYAPSFLAFFALRALVNRAAAGGTVAAPVTMHALLANLSLWTDPLFAGLFFYFMATLLGGVSMVLMSRLGACLRLLWREPEWLVFSVLILAASAAGSADIWRYLAFLTPAMGMLFARLDATWSAPTRIALFTLAGALTFYTQRPFRTVTLERYFSEWFPYYTVTAGVPAELQLHVSLWPAWGWRFLVVAVGLVVMSALHDRLARVPDETPALVKS